MLEQDKLLGLIMLVPLILSLSVHEWAHAYSAHRLGDDTARHEGRLTLNPIAHIDPIGTLVLPIMSIFFTGGVFFGWARPVPVNPLRFRRDVSMRTGMMITAAAGPLSNLAIALVCTVLVGVVLRVAPQMNGVPAGVFPLLSRAIALNVVLAIFNLLPIPPLDGSRVMDGLIPYRYRPQWEAFTRYSSVLLIGAIIFGSYVLAAPMRLIMGLLVDLIGLIAPEA